MNIRLITRLLLAPAIALSLAATAPAQDETEQLLQNEAFSNLPKAKRQAFTEHLIKASKLFSEKRIFEALDEVIKAEAIFPESAVLGNLKGSCYVEFRDFDRARAVFLEALELSPDSHTVRFNLAEVSFCNRQWQQAHDSFTEVLGRLKKKQVAMRRLVEFKILLCKLKIDQVEEARKLADKHGFLDDSPYHFFSKAAIAFHDENPVEAEEWLGRGMRIFRNPQVLAPWQDTLIEFGYIKSFYGGDLVE